MGDVAKTVMWFRRDLRLCDNPALLDAVTAGSDGVVPLFVLDDQSSGRSGTPHQAYLGASLTALAEAIGGLHIVHGKASEEVIRVARAVGAESVHIAADFTPYFRIFNPTTQGKKFDKAGDYIRRYVPELAELDARHIHEPWLLHDPPEDYPPPLVDHAQERLESLARYDEIRAGIR